MVLISGWDRLIIGQDSVMKSTENGDLALLIRNLANFCGHKLIKCLVVGKFPWSCSEV